MNRIRKMITDRRAPLLPSSVKKRKELLHETTPGMFHEAAPFSFIYIVYTLNRYPTPQIVSIY